MSMNKSEICIPYVDVKHLGSIPLKHITTKQLFIIFAIIWTLLIIEPCVEYFSKKSICKPDRSKKMTTKFIPWLTARLSLLVLFSTPIIILTSLSSRKEEFCLMNRKESVCAGYWRNYLDCFKTKSNFAGFVDIGTGFYTCDSLG